MIYAEFKAAWEVPWLQADLDFLQLINPRDSRLKSRFIIARSFLKGKNFSPSHQKSKKVYNESI